MKSLNDSLREEFGNILSEPEIQNIIEEKNLDRNLINRAFSKLLDNKNGGDVDELVKKGRAEFETYIINTLKTKSE